MSDREIIEDIKKFLDGLEYDKLTENAKVICTTISLIICGKIKVVKWK